MNLMVIKMETKRLEIESILRDLYKSVTVGKVNLTSNIVYSYLTKRNVSKEDLTKNMNFLSFSNEGVFYNPANKDDFFSRWIEDFKNKENIDVFCSNDWRYFCQFQNGNLVNKGFNDYVKVYIPLDYDHIYEGVKSIFTFLADTNIQHLSKVSSGIRFDDVVVRLTNLNDARKLQAFIDSNKYIQSGLIKSNAFAFSERGLSYAYDGKLSFNYYVSSMVADYVNQMGLDESVTIEDINLGSFYSYVDYVSKDISKIASLLAEKYKNSSLYDGYLMDAYFIVDLLKKSLVSNRVNDYEQAYVDFSSNSKKREVNHIINGNKTENKESLFQELILTTMKKYPLGSNSDYPNLSGFDYLYSFLKGNKKAITRDNNLRERVNAQLSVEDVYNIVYSSGVLGDTIDQKLTNYIKMVMLNDIIRCMESRRGVNTVSNIKEFMRTNNPIYITNKIGNARKLVFTFQGKDMSSFLSGLGCGIEEYIEYYYKKNSSGYERR